MLRLFAFLAVFLRHAFQKTPAYYFSETHRTLSGRAVSILGWSGGYGVDLFFVLSAFLITQLLTREQEVTGTLDVGRFYIRRILRIWPLYFAYLLVIAVIGISIAQFHTAAKCLFLFALLSGNIANALWGWTPTFIASHLWSIMVALEAVVKGLARPTPFAGDWIESSAFAALCALGLTIAISAASYRLLETPFLMLKSRFALIRSRPA